MVAARLREVMLRATNAGELAGADVRTGGADHPVCGDRVEFDLRLAGGTVSELRWRARGCPATMAAAALAGEVLPGSPAGAAAARLHEALAAHGGLAAHERHAEALVLRAFAAAGGGS